eukprot:UN28483
MLKALRFFHDKGWLHRDIKPSNFIQPLKIQWEYHCYVVDFGLAKRWCDENGTILPPEISDDFVGTSLYAPIAAHEKKAQCRRDDLWSLLFMIIDVSTNSLPWKDTYLHMEGRPTNERRRRMFELKKKFSDHPERYLKYSELLEYIDELKSL